MTQGDLGEKVNRDREREINATIRREVQKASERADWANLWRVYERCVEIAELVWTSRLDGDMKAQQALAEAMRDRDMSITLDPAHTNDYPGVRGVMLADIPVKVGTIDRGIPVPLFTPRDRAQFIKEAAATLLISADRKNLSVRFPKDKPDAPEEQETAPQPGVEAASGTSEGEMEPETPVAS